MADFESEVIILKPIEEVYEFVASMENMPEMMPNIVKIEKNGKDSLKPGDKVTETRLIRGRETVTELDIIAVEKNGKFSYRSEMNGLESTYQYTFEEKDGGTRVHFEAFIKTSGLRMRLTKRFIVDMLKREDGNQVKYLKETMEAN